MDSNETKIEGFKRTWNTDSVKVHPMEFTKLVDVSRVIYLSHHKSELAVNPLGKKHISF